jgi:hypothetical protein
MGNCFSNPTDVDAWKKLEGKKTPLSLDGKVCLARAVSVYDGDTCTLNIQTEFGVHQWKVRMGGYDSPELHPKKTDIKDEKERAVHAKHGKACKILMERMIKDRYIVIQCGGFGKYGRLLGNLYAPLSGKHKEGHMPTTREAVRKDLRRVKNADFGDNVDGFLQLNQWMVEKTPSKSYDGGKKSEFDFTSNYGSLYNDLLK